MLLNIAVTYAISHTTAPPPAHIQELVDHIRVPRGAGAATHH
jgi:cation/acetate symporter